MKGNLTLICLTSEIQSQSVVFAGVSKIIQQAGVKLNLHQPWLAACFWKSVCVSTQTVSSNWREKTCLKTDFLGFV